MVGADAKTRMKTIVAHVIYDLATAGAQTVVMNYLRSMQQDTDFDMYVVVGNRYTGLQYEVEAEQKGFKVIYANYTPIKSNNLGFLRPILNWFRYQRSLYKALRTINPDIVHTHLTQILPFVAIPVLLLGTKKLHTLHSDPYAIEMRFYVFAMIVFHLFRFHVIGVTELQAEKAKKRYHLKNVPVVHNGLNFENYCIDESKFDIRSELRIPRDTFIVGSVGRLDKVKNYPFLLKVFAELVKDSPNSTLLLVGDGVEKANLMALAENYKIKNKVVFAGLRKDVQRMYHVMDVFTMTSFSESSSIVTVEAQASGLRCVVASSIPENVIVTDDNVSTLSLDNPIQDWVDALKGDYPRRKKVSDMSLFSIDRTIIELKEVYFHL